MITVSELIEKLKKYEREGHGKMPVRMIMDWDELDEVPEHLQQQWEDDLGEVFKVDGSQKVLMLANKHFK